jgi:hypothetical protein
MLPSVHRYYIHVFHFNGGMPRFCNHKPRSSSNGAQYVALQKRKSDEAESKHVGLAQQNGFGPAFLHRRIWRLGNSTVPSFSCMGEVGKKTNN